MRKVYCNIRNTFLLKRHLVLVRLVDLMLWSNLSGFGQNFVRIQFKSGRKNTPDLMQGLVSSPPCALLLSMVLRSACKH